MRRGFRLVIMRSRADLDRTGRDVYLSSFGKDVQLRIAWQALAGEPGGFSNIIFNGWEST